MIIDINDDLQFLEVYQQFKSVNSLIHKINEFMVSHIKKSVVEIGYYKLKIISKDCLNLKRKKK